MGSDCQDRYVQDERYFAIEHMDVRREASRGPQMFMACPEARHHTSVAGSTDEISTTGNELCVRGIDLDVFTGFQVLGDLYFKTG